MYSGELVEMLEVHDIYADRCRIWRISDQLGLRLRVPGSNEPRQWTEDQALLVLTAARLRNRFGFPARMARQLALTYGGDPDPMVDDLRRVYRRVVDSGGIDRPTSRQAA